MDTLLYLVFGVIDVFMIMALIFKIFRWPLFAYFRECLIIAGICSGESFLTRVVLNITEFDLLIQVFTIMLLLKYLIKVNFYHSLILAVVGALAYSEIVFVVVKVLSVIGVVTHADIVASIGFGIFTIQFLGELAGALVACMIYRFNLGFAFVSVPPHDSKRRFSSEEKASIVIHFIAAMVVASATFWLVTFAGYGLNVIMVVEALALIAVLWLAWRRDYA